ncbi:unnamed protein product [Eruca vesicaria subsp. sativa]|uniref:Uncharacterized protein n=1 Tax=Eruca vesicaria subsp. sativa TaxID=29727 RepID=A0ABC8LGF0_ERUVS|nr:unnamed protein product [Eruca vesicaria subsp. sativa]
MISVATRFPTTVTTSSQQCWKQFSACRTRSIVIDSPRNQGGLFRTAHRTVYHEGMDGHNRLETKDSTHTNRGYETHGRVKKSHQNLQKPAQQHTQPITADEEI